MRRNAEKAVRHGRGGEAARHGTAQCAGNQWLPECAVSPHRKSQRGGRCAWAPRARCGAPATLARPPRESTAAQSRAQRRQGSAAQTHSGPIATHYYTKLPRGDALALQPAKGGTTPMGWGLIRCARLAAPLRHPQRRLLVHPCTLVVPVHGRCAEVPDPAERVAGGGAGCEALEVAAVVKEDLGGGGWGLGGGLGGG